MTGATLICDDRQQWLEDVFQSSPVGYFIIGDDGRIEDANASALACAGAPREAVIGLNLVDAGGDPEQARAVLAALSGTGSVLEADYQSPTGTRRGYYRMTFRPQALTGGRYRVLMSLENISANRLVEHLADRERTLKSIVDNMTDVFYRVDTTGKMVMVSQSCQRMFGRTVEQMLELNALDVYVDPAERPRFLELMTSSDGMVEGFDALMYRADGRSFWASTSAHYVYDDQGDIIGVEGVIRDISDRKDAESQLANGRNLVQALLDASTDATMLFTLDGTLLALNSVLAQRFGKKPEDLIGDCVWDIFPPDVAAKRRVATQQVAEMGQPVHFEDMRNGRHLDNHIFPVPNAEGQIDKIAVFSRDVTERTRNEQRINDYIAEIERSNAELEQFASVASHDLREPMRMIGSYVDLLGRRYADKLDEDAQAYIDYARTGVARLNRIVLDLLEYSRIGRVTEAIGLAAMSDMAQMAVDDLAGVLNEVQAVVQIDPEMPARSIEVTQIEQVYRNLISNAVKYRQEDTPLVIHIGWRASDNAFFVSDTGQGIAPEHFERIFLLFQRLHSGWQAEGTGIGLAICKKVVERHRGRIWVESRIGQGTTFFFTLPAGHGAEGD